MNNYDCKHSNHNMQGESLLLACCFTRQAQSRKALTRLRGARGVRRKSGQPLETDLHFKLPELLPLNL